MTYNRSKIQAQGDTSSKTRDLKESLKGPNPLGLRVLCLCSRASLLAWPTGKRTLFFYPDKLAQESV